MELSRWHASSCQTPDVLLELNIIRCRACDCQCDWEELLAIAKAGNAQASALIMIPPDEPISNRNLFWPPCVPYSKASPESSSGNVSAHSRGAQVALDLEFDIGSKSMTNPELRSSNLESESPGSLPLVQPSPAAERRSVFSPVKREAIAPDEFRLACLSATSDPNYPVHLSLEIYSHDNCPEYETVSYTWGGENGDNNLSRPVYIGPFWDVLLQTENCWEMLRFVRPPRGIRIIWVDALCINQDNIKERGEQVANMGNIYRESLRTIIYLGPDLILPTHNRFPRRERLQVLEKSAVDLHLPETSHAVKSLPDLLQVILKRRYFSRVWVIQELVLSRQAILRIGDVDFLTDQSVWEDLTEGWLWDSTTAPWLQYMAKQKVPVQNVFELMRLTSRSQAADARDRLFGVINLMEAGTEASKLTPDYSLSKMHTYVGFFAHCLINLKMLHLFRHVAGLQNPLSLSWVPDWEPQRSWEGLFSELTLTHETEPSMAELTAPHRTYLTSEMEGYVSHARPWYKDICIDKDTGAMSIFLTRFGVLPCEPQLVESVGPKHHFKFAGRDDDLFLITNTRLDRLEIKPGRDSLFILDHGDRNFNLTFFILRDLGQPHHERQYRLVASCSGCYLENLKYRPLPFSLRDLRFSVFEQIRQIQYSGNSGFTSDIKQFFPRFARMWEILPVVRAWHLYGDGDRAEFNKLYIQFIQQKLNPESWSSAQEGYMQFSFQPEEWETLSHYYIQDIRFYTYQKTREFNQWLDGDEWVYMNKKLPVITQRSPFNGSFNNMKVRIEIRALHSILASYVGFMGLSIELEKVQKVMKLDYDEVVSLCESELSEDLRFIGCPKAFKTLNDFQIDGSTFQVQIF